MWSLHRLRKSWEFSRVFKEGKKVANPEFAIFYFPNQLNNCHFGISIPRKKVAKKATQRNYCKRQIKNILALFLKERQDNCQVYQINHHDLVIIITRSGLSKNFFVKQKSLVELLTSIFQKEMSSVNLTKDKATTYA